MKRWIAGILMLCMLQTAGFTADAEEQTEDSAAKSIEDLGFLNALGIMIYDDPEEIDPDAEMTRGEFVNEAAKLLQFNTDSYAGENPFSDVDRYTDGYSAILMLAGRNIVYGYGDGTFRPDDIIDTDSAAEIALRLLGYGAISDEKLNARIKSKIGFTAVRPLTAGDAAALFVRTLNCECVENVISAKKEYTANRTLLEVQFGLELLSGKVTANEYTALDNIYAAPRGSVKIDNVEYEVVSDIDLSELLGYKIKFYCRENDYGDYELVYAEPRNTSVTIIDAADIVDFSAGKLSYKEGKRTKTISIPASADIIYNGRACPDYTDEQMTPKQGKLTLLTNDTSYETVLIEDVVDEIVYSVTDDTIYFESGSKIVPEDYEENFCRLTNAAGEEIAMSALAAKTVVSVTQSADGELIRLTACTDTISGAVTSIDEDDITINANPYELSPYFGSELLELGMGYSFRLNIFGRIADADSSSSAYKFAYLVKIKRDEEDRLLFGLLLEDDTTGFYRSADRTILNGISVNEQRLLTELSNDGAAIRQLIRIKLNSDDEIKLIETAANLSNYTGMLKDDNKIEGLRVSSRGTSLRYKSVIRSFNGIAPVSAATKVFFVKTDATLLDSANFYTGTSSNLTNDVFYTFDAYNTQPGTRVAEAMVIYDSSESSSISETTGISIVLKRMNTVDSDNVPAVQLMVLKDNKELGYMLDDSIDADNIPGELVNDSTSPDRGTYKLSPGDAVRFAVNDKGRISQIRMVYDVDNREGTKGFAYNLGRYTTGALSEMKFRILCGDAYDVDNGILRVAKKDLHNAEQVDALLQTNLESFQNYASCPTYLVSKKSGRWQASQSTPTRIIPYTHDPHGFSKLVVVTQYAQPIMMIIYEEE